MMNMVVMMAPSPSPCCDDRAVLEIMSKRGRLATQLRSTFIFAMEPTRILVHVTYSLAAEVYPQNARALRQTQWYHLLVLYYCTRLSLIGERIFVALEVVAVEVRCQVSSTTCLIDNVALGEGRRQVL
jgi:hypothetical protein